MPDVFLKHVLLVRQQMAKDVLCRFSLVGILTEVQFADEEVADGPDPLRTLVIVLTSCLVVVVVVTLILHVAGIESLDTHSSFSHQDILDDSKAPSSLIPLEKLWSYSHRDT